MVRCLFSLFLLSAVFASGCTPAKPIAQPRIFHDSDCGKAYLEDSSKQKHRCRRACVLGFELGKSSYVEVKAKLPQKADPRDQNYGTYGPFFITNGAAYGIAGLQSVAFSFDGCWKLATVSMNFTDWGFAAYKRRIASQYRLLVRLSGGVKVYEANPGDSTLGDYFGDYLVVSETYNEDYQKTFYSVSYTTTLPFELRGKLKAQNWGGSLY